MNTDTEVKELGERIRSQKQKLSELGCTTMEDGSGILRSEILCAVDSRRKGREWALGLKGAELNFLDLMAEYRREGKKLSPHSSSFRLFWDTCLKRLSRYEEAKLLDVEAFANAAVDVYEEALLP